MHQVPSDGKTKLEPKRVYFAATEVS